MVLSMTRWIGKVAVVTGASSGIGAAIAKQLVKAKINVVGLARRNERVEELAKDLSGEKAKLYAVKCDMTEEEDILKAFKWTKENVGPVSILVNNAGLGQDTTLLNGDTNKWKRILDTNILGLCIATREAYMQMKEANIDDGHIIHMNSIAGHIIPRFFLMNVYPASKHAVTALAETLRHELNSAKSKIKITSLSPGYVESEIFLTSGLTAIPDVFKKAPNLKPEDIADAVSYILSTPNHVNIQELIIKPANEKI